MPSFQHWIHTFRKNSYALYLVSRDRRTPWYAQLLALMVVAYLLSPLDLIPDFIPVIGYLDDMVIIPLAIWLVIKLIPLQLWTECKQVAQNKIASLPPDYRAAVVIVLIWSGVLILLGFGLAKLIAHYSLA